MAVMIGDGPRRNIWVYDFLAKTALRRLTFAEGTDPHWTPDGKHIVFASHENRKSSIFWQAADGRTPAERLTPLLSGLAFPHSASPRGIVSFTNDAGKIWTIRLDADRTPAPLIDAKGVDHEKFSPDGRWMAYQANESGRAEIYVQPIPPTGAKYLISTHGGRQPLWSPDGRQLFSVSIPAAGAAARIMSGDIHTQPSFAFGTPAPLAIDYQPDLGYDITPDGKQFLMAFPRSEAASGNRPRLQIEVVLNWTEELKRLVPVK